MFLFGLNISGFRGHIYFFISLRSLIYPQTYDIGSIPALIASLRDLFNRYAGIKALISATERNEQTLEMFTKGCGLFAKGYPFKSRFSCLYLQLSTNLIFSGSMSQSLHPIASSASFFPLLSRYTYIRLPDQTSSQTSSPYSMIVAYICDVAVIAQESAGF